MPRKQERLTLDQRAAIRLSEESPGMEYIAMDRQAICRTEIDSAIHLFFYRDDLIAAHMLASAAMEIMTALSGGDQMVGINRMRTFLNSHNIHKELTDEVFESMKHSYNFSKHSSTDASVVNDYPVNFMIMTIWEAVHTYKSMFQKITPEMLVFYGAVMSWKIDWWNGAPGQSERRKTADEFGLSGKTRAEVQLFGRKLLERQTTVRQ